MLKKKNCMKNVDIYVCQNNIIYDYKLGLLFFFFFLQIVILLGCELGKIS